MNQSATCLSVWASAAAATASRSPFWRRPRRLGRSASGEQAWPSASTTRAGAPPRHGLRAQGLPEPLLDEAAQVRPRPARWFAPLRGRPDQNPGDEHGLLALAQDLRSVPVGAVEEAGETLGVETQDGVAQRLPLDPGRSRSLRPAHPLQRVRDRQHPLGRAPARFLLGQPSQLRRHRTIPPDRQPASHPRLPPEHGGRESRPQRQEKTARVTSSPRRYHTSCRDRTPWTVVREECATA
jgi:hypothetical protein